MASSESAEGRTVISKAATILMAYLYGESHSLTELTTVCDLPLSTTHRLVSELAHCKILDRTDSGEYRVGIPVRKIGGSKRCAIDLEEQSHFALQDLSYTLDVTVRLGVLHEGEVAYVEKLTGRRPVTGFQEARHVPAHATALGKALLAFSPQQTVHAILLRGLTAFTPYTLTTPERFRRALAMTRLSRLAVSHRELTIGQSAIAVPVLNSEREAVAAIEVLVDDPVSALATVRPALDIACRSLSRQLGYAKVTSPPRGLNACLTRGQTAGSTSFPEMDSAQFR
jgi:DNA-binding IclR family transcriptional regulator